MPVALDARSSFVAKLPKPMARMMLEDGFYFPLRGPSRTGATGFEWLGVAASPIIGVGLRPAAGLRDLKDGS